MSIAEVEIVVSDVEVEVVNVSIAEVGIAVFVTEVVVVNVFVAEPGWYSCVCNRGGSSRNCSIAGISIGGIIQVCSRGGNIRKTLMNLKNVVLKLGHCSSYRRGGSSRNYSISGIGCVCNRGGKSHFCSIGGHS